MMKPSANEPGAGCGEAPSAWVERFAAMVPPGQVLDVAAGGGRHARLFLALGRPVLAVDRNVAGLSDLKGQAGLEIVEADLEAGAPWRFGVARFAGVVVTNYLHRPILGAIVDAVAPGGLLIYETFAVGNARFGRPSNPDFLLAPDELLRAVAGRLSVIAFEDLEVAEPRPARVQRIAARRA